ncbi:MAG TPA: c-type cytochrome [Arenimonas sp.]|uniref:c-type cytochrome n=1 Tax=Arenimonas sp. TaxID=1872635 RepID=UPI002C69ECC8|nr:c-type cytochrome [Arenimonas sp.]HMB58042.1 c-type cytochrome [Arenimonas sp.]
MKFLRILGMASAVLVTTAVAQQAATVTPLPDPAPAPAAAIAAAAAADAKPATFGDVKAGQTKAGACAACHGLDGNSSDPQYPRLAGQHERYIWRQLKMFKSGERNNAIMMGMGAPLSEQDMRDIGAYFATQKAVPGVADDTKIATGPNQGRKFYQVGESIFRAGKPEAGVPACMACHGPSGRGNPGPSYPSIGGQHAGYTVAKLQAFRGGEVWGKAGNANVIMSGIAHNLSDEEIQSLATYIEGLHNSRAAAKAE